MHGQHGEIGSRVDWERVGGMYARIFQAIRVCELLKRSRYQSAEAGAKTALLGVAHFKKSTGSLYFR